MTLILTKKDFVFLRDKVKKPITFSRNNAQSIKTLIYSLSTDGDTGACFPAFIYLYFAGLPTTVHTTGHIDRVPPDVVLRFPRPDHSSYHWSMVDSYLYIKKNHS